MTTYTKADPGEEVHELLAEVMREHHPKLAECGARVGVVWAYCPGGHAIKHGGYPAAATIKVVSQRDRVTKEIDAEMLIDQHFWANCKDRHKAALLDHELSHLDVVPLPPEERRTGSLVWWKTDDGGRPKLKGVKGDWSAGDGFKAVVHRHGDFAVEFENIRRASAIAEAAKRGEV